MLDDGGVIFWDGTGDQTVFSNEDGEADTTMRLSAENLEKLIAGTLDPTMAYMTGKLKVEGKTGRGPQDQFDAERLSPAEAPFSSASRPLTAREASPYIPAPLDRWRGSSAG